MGTGLTYELDDNDLDAKRWVLECLALQFFGAFYDHSFGLKEEQLEKLISESHDIEYHEEKLAELRKRKEETSEWVKEQWQAEYNKVATHISEANVKSVQNAASLKAKHDAVYADLKKLSETSEHRIVKDIASFGMRQLDQEKDDTVPHIARIPSLERYIDEEKEVMAKEIPYHEDELKKARENTRKSLEDYRVLRKETHRILDQPK